MTIKRSIKFVPIFIIVLYLAFSVSSYLNKTEKNQIFKNIQLSYGTYLEDVTSGRGGLKTKYKFIKNDIIIASTQGKRAFDNSNPTLGKNYIVAFNSKNPSENICFLNLEVHDSIRHYFKNGSLSQLPIESYQRSVDSFFLRKLTGGLDKYFPPYYKKEDFPELEYLWGEEE